MAPSKNETYPNLCLMMKNKCLKNIQAKCSQKLLSYDFIKCIYFQKTI